MRKFEREVVDTAEKFAILGRCGCLTLALYGENAPYCLPLNFGAELQGEKLVLYFHCAKQGTKLALLQRDGRVGFAAANMLRVFNKGVAPCGYTADYESGSIKLQDEELSAGAFYGLDNLPELPQKLSIARRLIDAWIREKKNTL